MCVLPMGADAARPRLLWDGGLTWESGETQTSASTLALRGGVVRATRGMHRSLEELLVLALVIYC